MARRRHSRSSRSTWRISRGFLLSDLVSGLVSSLVSAGAAGRGESGRSAAAGVACAASRSRAPSAFSMLDRSVNGPIPVRDAADPRRDEDTALTSRYRGVLRKSQVPLRTPLPPPHRPPQTGHKRQRPGVRPGRHCRLKTPARQREPAYSSSSGCSSGGARPSSPLSSSSSVIRSMVTSVSSESTPAPAAAPTSGTSGSGSSTST